MNFQSLLWYLQRQLFSLLDITWMITGHRTREADALTHACYNSTDLVM